MKQNLGLVLTGGGARGAYQAGAIRALSEIFHGSDSPFSIFSGVSAGSINATYMAAQARHFKKGAEGLSDLWSKLESRDVFLSDGLTLTRTGLAWLSDLGFGGWTGGGKGQSLLKTEPLAKLLDSEISYTQIDENIKTGHVRGVAVTATNYYSGTSVTFYDGNSEIEPWIRSTRMAVRAKLDAEHVMASSAIPVFFPAIKINGAYYGDGCVRMTTPLSPAIHLGSDKIIAIGVRAERSPQRVADLNSFQSARYPYLAEVAGVLLNAMFLDALDGDVERMERINSTLELIPEEKRALHPSKLRKVPVFVIKPSMDLGSLVTEVMSDFPLAVRHFMKGLGVSSDRGMDLLSYLAFDSAYTSVLVKLGYEDTLRAKSSILKFVET